MRIFALAVALTVCATAAAATRTYVVAVGNNAPPLVADEPGLQPLRYADDDAAAVFDLAAHVADGAVLLAVLDADTQRRFPRAAVGVRPPTLAALREVLAELHARMSADRARGDGPELIFFFSGHGFHDGDGASLALLDGALTRRILYDEILAALPARFVHLLVDACHAEAFVRPRDASAEVVDVTPADAGRFVARETLARFPHVGAIVATTRNQQAHEWDAWQSGVFTHEVLSGLRGAADVNGDRRVEYSELHAFLAAANREVADPRARLDLHVRPPPLDLHAPLVDLRRARRLGWGVAPPAGTSFHVEDELGQRLVAGHAEPGHAMVIALPAARRLFLHAGGSEAELRVEEGGAVRLDRLPRRPPAMAPRGALASALERGLFVAPFGPLYYRGFVDREGGLSVSFAAPRPEPRPRARTVAGGTLLGVSAASLSASIALGALAAVARAEWEAAEFQRPAAEARARHDAYLAASLATLGAGVATAVAGALVFPWRKRVGTVAVAPLPGGGALSWSTRF